MNLLQIRQWFVRESGRWDLVVDGVAGDWTDSGANAYITAGQRILDRMLDTNKMVGRNFQMLVANQCTAIFSACRAIKEVWVVEAGSGGRRWKLEKKDMSVLRAAYANMETVTAGAPLYYAPAVLRAAPELALEAYADFNALIAYMDVSYTNHYAYNGVVFFPPTDAAYMLETWGLFYSTPLASDTDESYWSVQHPELLVQAAMLSLEEFNRNSEGVKDWTMVIGSKIAEIDKDAVEEDIAETDEMEA